MVDDRTRIRHMLDAAHEAQSFMHGVSFEQLPHDRKTLQSVVRAIEIIGEAATHISDDLKDTNPSVPWQQIVGMRNRLIHAYFDVDAEHIWNTVKKDLPALIEQLKIILKGL